MHINCKNSHKNNLQENALLLLILHFQGPLAGEWRVVYSGTCLLVVTNSNSFPVTAQTDSGTGFGPRLSYGRPPPCTNINIGLSSSGADLSWLCSDADTVPLGERGGGFSLVSIKPL